MEYKQTLNLPLADGDPGALAQRANLPTREPEIQALWEEIGLYKRSLEKPSPNGTFVLHDGPPYSNGNIHAGHALNKIGKDIIVKYKSMRGFKAPYVPGWDNHGMPIENEVSKEFRKKGEKPDKVTMRKRCREYAAGFVDKQKGQFKRLGVRGNWDHPYLTMASAFEASIVEAFGDLAQKGFVYRGLKPVMWCSFCETALADAEVEYEPHTSTSIYVRFPVTSDPSNIFGRGESEPADSYVIIWTTTPWTIPANLALAVAPDADYAVVETDGVRYLVAEPLLEKTLAAVGAGEHKVVRHVKGSELRIRDGSEPGLVTCHPLFERPSPVVFASYVTMEDGTGVVHTAPGHGKEDFETGEKYGLGVLNPVDASGTFTKEAGEQLVGARILDKTENGANGRVIAALRESGNLLAESKFEHSYPHCWRCHNPLIFRATVQWFMNIDHEVEGKTHRQRSLEQIEQTTWYPASSVNRISSMVGNRPDWCVSRQRAWGVGIPAFYCRDCGVEDLSAETIGSVVAHIREESSDVWYAKTAAELLPEGHVCKSCGGTTFDKETDILDVWFDSGSTHRAVLLSGVWPELVFPADVYLEGSDQHRGWFNSSLMVSVGTRGVAPYKSVITNGWVLDDNGKAMHKSLGNVVDPLQVIEMYGADILRLWVASADFFDDVRVSDKILGQVSETYRRIRNTLRWLVNNLGGFDPATDAVPHDQLQPLDQWALAQLDRLIATSLSAYDAYEFHRVHHAVNNFCAVEMSAFYLDAIKDRLYCSAKGSLERRSAQTALYELAHALCRLLAPILSHTAEETWQLLPIPDRAASVQLTDMPEPDEYHSRTVLEPWQTVMHVREQVNMALEAARQEKRIANPLQARVTLRPDAATWGKLDGYRNELATVFKVSQAVLENPTEGPLTIEVEPATGEKCGRCWLVREEVGSRTDYTDLCNRCAEVVAEMAA